METEIWVERVVIQELARADERRKHGYRTRTKPTGTFEWACRQLEEELATAEGEEIPNDPLDTIESTHQDAVADALQQLAQKGLIIEVDKMRREPMNPERESVWELTEDGLREAHELNEAWLRETVELSKKYGKVPDSY